MNKVIINGVEYAPIGKPRPLLADAKVGDLCKRRDGKYVQIIRIDTCHKRPYRYRDNEYGGEERGVTVAGSWICDDNGKRSFDIIATEPLAEEGSAEWAWQMLMLQKPVSHPAEGIWRDTYYSKDGFVRCMAKTGWQLYEEKPEPKPEHPAINGYNRYDYIPVEGIRQPKPEPEYKVGDWVTNGRVVGRVTLIKPEWIDIIDQHGIPHTLGLVNLHKLDPSEVRVKVVLEGTVKPCSVNTFELCTNEGRNWIGWKELDPNTAELVKALLKAQAAGVGLIQKMLMALEGDR